MADDEVPAVQFATLSREGFQAYRTEGPSVSKIEDFSEEGADYFEYSKDGSKIVVKKGDKVTIRSPDSGKITKSFEVGGLECVHISPRGSYLLTYVSIKKQEEGSKEGNLIVWDTKSGDRIGRFLQKVISKETWPFIRWTDDEAIAARRVTNEIHFWTGGTVSDAPIQKIRAENVEDFSLSPGKMNNYYIGVFVGEKKGNPAEVRLYKYPNQGALATKTFFADTVEFHWSPNGKHLLASAVQHVDRTGRSYYGQSGLYYLSEKAHWRVDTNTKKDGPVHTCCWNPNGLQYLAIYGFMPPNTTTFNLKGDPQSEFGTTHRNRAHFSPDGRLLWLAGLGGGLSGNMEFWNPKDLKKYGTAAASPSSTHFEWSPDSLNIMTAIVSPRMRVDNQFQIWDYQGNALYKEEFSELLDVRYRPKPSKQFPQPPLKYPAKNSVSAKASGPAPTPKKYVPPGRRDEGGVSTNTNMKRQVKPEDAKPKVYQPAVPKVQGSGIPGDTGPQSSSQKKKNRQKKKPGPQNLPPGY